ncbi:hypothetical protein GCM10027187_56020 [Streptosporangium sandarakinum]
MLNPRSVWERLNDAPRAGDGRSSELIRALNCKIPAPFAVRRFHPLPSAGLDDFSTDIQLASVPEPSPAAERGFDVDQTNHSVIVSESVVVKWLTPPAPLPAPTPDVFAHLTAVGFTATAMPYAAVSRHDDEGEVLLALVTAYLPGASDGWEWCVDEAVADNAGFATELGILTADLHAAMATPSETFPDPVQYVPAHPEPHARALRALREALALIDGEDGAWLMARAQDFLAALDPLARISNVPLIRIHGDLHVGQILRWRNGYAVIDFDGNPTVTDASPFQPAARDLAQLTTSLEHVSQVAIQRYDINPSTAEEWTSTARDRLKSAYYARLGEHGQSTLLDSSLLRPFEIEQELRELIYSARHLPRWRYAPMGVLRSWF